MQRGIRVRRVCFPHVQRVYAHALVGSGSRSEAARLFALAKQVEGRLFCYFERGVASAIGGDVVLDYKLWPALVPSDNREGVAGELEPLSKRSACATGLAREPKRASDVGRQEGDRDEGAARIARRHDHRERCTVLAGGPAVLVQPVGSGAVVDELPAVRLARDVAHHGHLRRAWVAPLRQRRRAVVLRE